MLAAQADVLVVGPQHHLLPLPEHRPVFVEAGVAGGLLAAPADGLDLLDDVGAGEQLLGAGEQISPEVGPQAVANNCLLYTSRCV